MLYAFVDESYCADWFFMVAAVAPNERRVAQLDTALPIFLFQECERLGIQQPAEVHGYELFQGMGPWAGVDLHTRLSVAGRALELISDCDVRFIIRGIDRVAQARRYPTTYDPYPMILTHVMQQVEIYAGQKGTDARIACDEVHQHDRHRAMLERHRRQGTPGYRKTTLSAVVGALDFTPSHNSAMIQAADVVAYLAHRKASRPIPLRAERRARDRLWRIVEPDIVHEYCWVP